MQLQEGSTISVNCAECGQERFQVTLLVGRQKIRCGRNTSSFTVVEVSKDRDGNLNVRTWRE